MRMEEVVRRLLRLGPGAQMACAWRSSEETPQVGPRCIDGKDGQKKCILDGAMQCTHRIVHCWVCSGRGQYISIHWQMV